MKAPSPSDRQAALEKLAAFASSGDAASQPEESFWKNYYVIPRHLRAFDRDTVLILGERGAGKSQLFQAIIKRQGLTELATYLGSVRLPKGRISWLAAYSGEGAGFPDHKGLRRCLDESEGPRDQNAMDLWMAYAIRTVRDELSETEKREFSGILSPSGAEGRVVLEAFHKLKDRPTILLDEVDKRLESQQRTLVLGYDELDRLGGFDYTLMRDGLRGLIGFWAHYYRRWNYIRGKLFLRTDLFRQFASLLGPDLSKLSASRVDIEWTDDELRLLLIKRLLNTHPLFLRYAKAAQRTIEETRTFGFTPKIKKTTDEWQPFIELLISPYMGPSLKKGSTWRWIIDHLRDGKGRAAPRPLLLLFEQAAESERQEALSEGSQLLNHVSIRRALDRVSSQEVNQAKELPWLQGLGECLNGLHVPAEDDEVVKRIKQRWKGKWSSVTDQPPPADTPQMFLDLLVEWGILNRRASGKIDVPDLYRHGLGLKRKGGVKFR